MAKFSSAKPLLTRWKKAEALVDAHDSLEIVYFTNTMAVQGIRCKICQRVYTYKKWYLLPHKHEGQL